MKITTRHIGLMFVGVGIISLSILVWDYETTKIDRLSQKIDSLLMLVSDCSYSYERTIQINEILYDAQTKLIIENNYDYASSLANLAGGKLFSCQLATQIGTPYLLLFPLLIMMVVWGLILSVIKVTAKPKWN